MTYTITLSNVGPSTAPAGVVVTDTIPAGTVGSESEADCAIAAGDLVCTTSSGLAPGDSVSWDVDVEISPGFLLGEPVQHGGDHLVTGDRPRRLERRWRPTRTLLPNAAIDVAASTTTASVGAGGQVVDYTFTVTNAGNQTLTGVSLTDPDCDPATLVYVAGDANNDSDLQLAETWTYTCERTVTQAEVDAGGPISTSVTADSAESAPATDSLDVPVILAPAIDVAASTTTASVGAGGQVVDYTFTVTNAGNQTLTGVSLTDPDCDPATLVYVAGDANNDSDLQLAETWTYTCERTVTQAEVDAGGPISTSVTADSAESAPATDSVDVPVILGPGDRRGGLDHHGLGGRGWPGRGLHLHRDQRRQPDPDRGLAHRSRLRPRHLGLRRRGTRTTTQAAAGRDLDLHVRAHRDPGRGRRRRPDLDERDRGLGRVRPGHRLAGCPGDPGPRRSTWRPPPPRPRWARVARSWTTPSP